MIKKKIAKEQIKRIHRRIRVKIEGCAERPRLAVYKSGKHIYAQLIDDVNHVTLASASTLDKDIREKIKNGANIESAKIVGVAIANKAKEKGIECVVFDRGGFLYHGRIAALADSAREAGLFF